MPKSKPTHTPGPWLLRTTGEIVVNNEEGGSDVICDLEEPTANAALIAAAPEMLEALEMLLRDLMDNETWGQQRAITCNKVLEAISKAKGSK